MRISSRRQRHVLFNDTADDRDDKFQYQGGSSTGDRGMFQRIFDFRSDDVKNHPLPIKNHITCARRQNTYLRGY